MQDTASIALMDSSTFKEYMDSFLLNIPFAVCDASDADKIGKLLVTSTNNVCLLTSLLSIIKPLIREEKRNQNKRAYEDLVDKRDLIEVYISANKQVNQTVSRLVTMRQMDIDEARLVCSRKGE